MRNQVLRARRRSARVAPRAALLAACGALLVPAMARAACASPLPDAALRSLDGRIDADPKGVVAEAQRRLAASKGADPFLEAQLRAVIADAQSLADDDAEVRRTIQAARSLLARVPDSPGRRALDLRLELTFAGSPSGTAESVQWIERLNKLEATLPAASLDHACLLVVRSRLNRRLLQHEEATTDALGARRIAGGLGARSAVADAGHQLAFAYFRAGLLDDAEGTIEEANDYYRESGSTARLASALFLQADILEKRRDYTRALALNAEVRKLDQQAQQPIDIALDDERQCAILLALQRLDDAWHSCMAARPVLAAAGRVDHTSVIEGHLARIEYTRGQPSASVARLNRLLGGSTDQFPPETLPVLYRLRSEALDQLGRPEEAFRDLQQATRLIEANDAERHNIAAARLKERAEAETLHQEKQLLEAQVKQQREAAEREARLSELRLVLAGSATLVLVVCALFLWKRARQERALRAASQTLESQAQVISNLREGVLLVDRGHRIRYANPAAARLFGLGREVLLASEVGRLGIGAEHLRSAEPGQPAPIGGGYELAWVGADGLARSIFLTCSHIALPTDAMTVCILQDITEFRQLERRLFSAASDERERISHEIHEGLSQELAMLMQLLKGISGRGPSDATKLEYLVSMLDELAENSRAIVQGLSPVRIESGSLPDALRRLVEEIATTHGLRIQFRCEVGGLHLGPWQADHFYRIAKATIELARREHDRGGMAVELRVAGDALTLAVSAEHAADADPAQQEHDWGGITYLAGVVGGATSILPLPEGGRRHTVTVPLAAIVTNAGDRRLARPPAPAR